MLTVYPSNVTALTPNLSKTSSPAHGRRVGHGILGGLDPSLDVGPGGDVGLPRMARHHVNLKKNTTLFYFRVHVRSMNVLDHILSLWFMVCHISAFQVVVV